MKIGICGQMCSGKTTIAKHIVSENNSYYVTSFAKKLKEIAKELFNMENKDRKLLIDIGKKMREINPDVWINYTIKDSNNYKNVIIDDVRYLNEFNKLKENNWTMIKLIISEELQLERMKMTYPDTWEEHCKHIKDNSENINSIPNDLFDFIIEINHENQHLVKNKIFNFLKL